MIEETPHTNLDQHMQEMENQKPQTFNEMAIYLLSKENCRVNGKGFFVMNLHNYVENSIEQIELIPKDQRKENLMCKTSKWAMERIFNAFVDGNIEPANTTHPKKYGSIWNN